MTINIPSQIEQYQSLGSRHWQCLSRSYHKRKLYKVAGPEFEELQGHILVIHKALYGLKSSGLRCSKTSCYNLDLNFARLIHVYGKRSEEQV